MTRSSEPEPEIQNELRLFLAVLIPDAWREYLAGAERALERASPGYARWVSPELLHLTLVFLGYQQPAQVNSILSAAREAAAASRPFELTPGRPGSFGPAARPRVVWVDAVDRAQALERLHQALVPALRARGVSFDERALVPHITLGRAQREATAQAGRLVSAALAASPLPQGRPGPFTVEALSLMRSELSRQGPRYTELERVPLGAWESGGAGAPDPS